MSKYWAVFLFDEDGKETWNSSKDFEQDWGTSAWKSLGVWDAADDRGTYVYVEGEFEEEE